MSETTTTLTCIYCGHAYPPGTPSHGAQVLTDHIRVCEKHPMRALAEENDRLKLEIKRFKSDGQPADPVKVAESIQALAWVSELRVSNQKLRAALVGLVGVDTKEELEQMEAVIRLTVAPAADKVGIIDAIHALIATL